MSSPTNGAQENDAPGSTLKALWESAVVVSSMTTLHKLKILFYGPSGSGKTTLAAKFNRPLVGVTELQGIPAIMRSNPNARVFPITNAVELNNFRSLIRDPHLAEHVDAVVLDSLTDVQRIIKVAYTATQNAAKSKAGKDTKDTPDVDTWGLIIDRTAKIAREVRDLPVHVAVICLESETVVEGIGRVHRPAVNGKTLPNDLAQYFNVVGFTYKRAVENGIRHEVLLNGPESFLTKGMPEIRDIEPPEPLWLAHKCFGEPLPDDVAARVAAWEALAVAGEQEESALPEPAPAPAPAKKGGKAAAKSAAPKSDDPFNV